jgi:hypothetical protein
MSSSSSSDLKTLVSDVSEVSSLFPIESYSPDDGPLTDLQIAMIRQLAAIPQGKLTSVRTTLLEQEK